MPAIQAKSIAFASRCMLKSATPWINMAAMPPVQAAPKRRI